MSYNVSYSWYPENFEVCFTPRSHDYLRNTIIEVDQQQVNRILGRTIYS